MKIKDIEIIWLDVPFHPIPQRNMERQQHGWRICEICRVTTDTGVTGIGETLPNYTWGKVTQKSIDRAKGANPFELLWDDSLGAGLQQALFDVCGKAEGVPAYRLLGSKVRDWCPISWWGIDMSAEDYAAEARDAVATGYTTMKQKARPWWDVYEQVRQTVEQIPRDFKLDFDYNQMLVNASTAIPVILELDEFPHIAIYESPILHKDIEGNRRLRDRTQNAIAFHYNDPDVNWTLREDACDGYVVGGGASRTMKAAYLCEQMHKMFWLQLVGTGLTTAWTMHLGAVCSHAQWPAVTCMNMYTDPLIKEPLEVVGGYIRVPEKPGIGVEFDEDAIAKYRVDSPDKANADALYAVVRDYGVRTWYDREFGGFWKACMDGNEPLHERGVKLERWDNDGSKEWKALKARVQNEIVREKIPAV